MAGLMIFACECGTECKMVTWCYCCPWCCGKCMNGGGCRACKAHYIKRTTGQWTNDCYNLICEKQCRGKEKTCPCKCCREKCARREIPACSAASSPDAVSSPGSPGSPGPATPPRAQHNSATQQHTTGSSSPAVLPIIIAAVALIIVVICVMIYFRIRPFHRVRYLLRS
ncbi:hypothetical protein BBBOND_0111400 [Babesia bigemina]|uniref:Uncharacterized protein n=1 Tax=Babesia bigemina TaxID=5866 RepID=A0A061D473_BABBI|nr:hypothetical protein BBBOND_0111400 [Babesia bigemina]CDR94842.1 hypothetical protein BBBOND_0111400 [Babesia bigemina]|eukprot:XP_012767028.1 hypothetical protein BBBOND_0111400 [Babesia bigemina]